VDRLRRPRLDHRTEETVGEQIKACLQRHQFDVEWSGDPESRLAIPKLDWKRRRRPE